MQSTLSRLKISMDAGDWSIMASAAVFGMCMAHALAVLLATGV